VRGIAETHDHTEIAEVKAFDQNRIPMENLAHDHAQQLRDYFAGVARVA